MSGMDASSEKEETTLEEIKTILEGGVKAKGSEGIPLKQEPTTGELHVKTV